MTGPAHSGSGVCVTAVRQNPAGPSFSGGSIPAARARGGRWEEAESAQLPQPHSRFGHRRRKEPPASTHGDGKKAPFAGCCHATRSFQTLPWMWVRGHAALRASLVGFFFYPPCGRISAAGRRKSGSGAESRTSRRERFVVGVVMAPVIRLNVAAAPGADAQLAPT